MKHSALFGWLLKQKQPINNNTSYCSAKQIAYMLFIRNANKRLKY